MRLAATGPLVEEGVGLAASGSLEEEVGAGLGVSFVVAGSVEERKRESSLSIGQTTTLV